MNFLGVVFWMFLNNIKLIPLSYNISYCRALFRALEHLLEQPNYIPGGTAVGQEGSGRLPSPGKEVKEEARRHAGLRVGQ